MNRLFALAAVGVALAATPAVSSASPFTMNSPTGGVLPAGVTEIGGIVVDIKGTNGARVVSQLSASSLFVGFNSVTDTTIGTQTGFSPAVLAALGGGISDMSVRITLYDGDTGPGNFDENKNTLRLNGISAGNFSDVVTQETNATGLTVLSNNPSGGFRNGLLDNGFFHVTNAADLTAIYNSLVATNQLVFVVRDTDPGDNFYDFTQGVDGGLINVGQGPQVAGVPEPATLGVFGVLAAGAFGLRRRKAAKA